MDADHIAACARRLIDAARTRAPYERLDGALADAYEVQRHYVELAQSELGLGRSVGYKIALTSEAMQTLVGVSEPLYGHVFETRVLHPGCSVVLGDYQHIGMEFEVAVRGFQAAGGKGLNITVPHKQKALELAARASEAATRAQAANTLDFRDGSIMRDEDPPPRSPVPPPHATRYSHSSSMHSVDQRRIVGGEMSPPSSAANNGGRPGPQGYGDRRL